MAAERGVAVDRAGFDAAMAEQRARSKSARVRVGFEGGPQLPDTRVRRVRRPRDARHRAAHRRRGGSRAPARRAPRTASSSTAAPSTPRPAARSATPVTSCSTAAGPACSTPPTRAPARVHTVRVEEGTLATGADRARGRRRATPRPGRPPPQRHPLPEPGAARGARQRRRAARLVRGPRPHHLRLLVQPRAHRRRAARRRGARQPPRPRRPAAQRRRHVAARGAGQRRHRPARREVHREGARRRLRRLVARALRRHPRAPHRRGGRGDHRRGEQHRPGRAPDRDGRRRGCRAPLARDRRVAAWPPRARCAPAPARSPSASPALQEQLKATRRELEEARRRGARAAPATSGATVEDIGGLRYAVAAPRRRYRRRPGSSTSPTASSPSSWPATAWPSWSGRGTFAVKVGRTGATGRAARRRPGRARPRR